MRLLIYILIFGLLSCNSLFSQQKNGNDISRIIYKESFYEKKDLDKIKDSNIREQMKEIIEIKKNIEYQLLFDNNESSYQQIDNLKVKDESPIADLARGFKQIFYNNIQRKENIYYSESTGKGFNIIRPYITNWTITKESKIIGGYLCYKATTHFEEENNLTNEKREFSPIIWFAPTIPVPFGPIGLNGLPGLVLEGTINGQTFYYASKIELKKFSRKEFSIVRPKGKEITNDEYNELLAKTFERN